LRFEETGAALRDAYDNLEALLAGQCTGHMVDWDRENGDMHLEEKKFSIW
jgi:hypothetical protein